MKMSLSETQNDIFFHFIENCDQLSIGKIFESERGFLFGRPKFEQTIFLGPNTSFGFHLLSDSVSVSFIHSLLFL